MIEIRRFVPSDISAMSQVRYDSIQNVASRDYSPEQVRAWADRKVTDEELLTRFLKTTTWIAEVESRVAGFTNLAADGLLDCMYVHSAFQGRGIATSLLNELEAEARKQLLERIHAEVSITARPFFEGRGFVVTAPQQVVFDGVNYDNFRMEKKL